MNDIIFSYLKNFVEAYGPLINLLPEDLKEIEIFSSYFPIKFEANLRIKKNLNKIDTYYFRISATGYIIKKKNNSFCNLTLSGSRKYWIEVFSGYSTLLGQYNLGHIKMNNVREYYILKLVALSSLLFSFSTKGQRLLRIGKDLKILKPFKPLISKLAKIGIKFRNVIPSYALERALKRISPFISETD